MSTPTETRATRERSWIYITVLVVLGVLAVVGAARLQLGAGDRQAEEKADELIAALEDAGRRRPGQDQIVRVLGDDGGAMCENPNDALSAGRPAVAASNGAAGPGRGR